MNLSINPVSSYAYQQRSLNAKNNQPAFTGVKGDEIVNSIIRGCDVQPKDIMKEVKGTFGIKSDNFTDIMDSFIRKIQDFVKENREVSEELYRAKQEIYAFPDKQRDLKYVTQNEMRESFSAILKAKDEEVAAAKAEAKEAKELAAKYEPAVKIKSVDEIDTVMPDEALKVFDEMIEHKIAARKSMFDYLFTGKGQEEALAQLDRSAMMGKAMQDGFFRIEDFSRTIHTKARANGLYSWGSGADSVFSLIKSALTGDPKGEYIVSPAVRKTVKDNAMALLTPLVDKNAPRMKDALLALEAKLDATLKKSLEFHPNLKRRIEQLKANNRDLTVKIERVPFDNNASKVLLYNKDNICVYERSFSDLA